MTLPAHLQKYQAPDIAVDLAKNLGSAMPPHVSIGGGRFTLIDASNAEIPVPTFDPAIGVYLDAVIIGSNPHKSRVYFSGQYDPNAEGVRPDCFSDNGVAPSTAASSPQSPTCAACPQAVWGSKISAQGKKIPACSEKQKVALLIPGMQTLFLLAVPPNSHSYLSEYVQKAMGSQVNIADVITRISFVPGIQGTLTFKAQGYIDEPTAVLRQAAYAEKKIDALVGKNDVPTDGGIGTGTGPDGPGRASPANRSAAGTTGPFRYGARCADYPGCGLPQSRPLSLRRYPFLNHNRPAGDAAQRLKCRRPMGVAERGNLHQRPRQPRRLHFRSSERRPKQIRVISVSRNRHRPIRSSPACSTIFSVSRADRCACRNG